MTAHFRKRPLWLVLTTLLFAGFGPGAAAAQQTGTIEGRVVLDRSAQSLGSVQVAIQALGIGTLTNQDGRFRLTNVPAGTHTLTAIRIGLSSVTETVTVTPGQVTVLNISLQQRALDLDAIVVTGQGSEISRRRLSTNIDVVSTDQIQNSSATRLDQLLQTALPSVQVRLASGQPGATSVTRGRGPVSAARSPRLNSRSTRRVTDARAPRLQPSQTSPSKTSSASSTCRAEQPPRSTAPMPPTG
jgi:hypothetical protein